MFLTNLLCSERINRSSVLLILNCNSLWNCSSQILHQDTQSLPKRSRDPPNLENTILNVTSGKVIFLSDVNKNNNEVSNAAKTYIEDVNGDTNNEVIRTETPARNMIQNQY